MNRTKNVLRERWTSEEKQFMYNLLKNPKINANAFTTLFIDRYSPPTIVTKKYTPNNVQKQYYRYNKKPEDLLNYSRIVWSADEKDFVRKLIAEGCKSCVIVDEYFRQYPNSSRNRQSVINQILKLNPVAGERDIIDNHIIISQSSPDNVVIKQESR